MLRSPAKARLVPFLNLVVASGLASLAAACAPSPLVRAAEQGSFDSLHETLKTRVASGTLHDGEARDVAFALAKGEIARSDGAAGEATLAEVRRCAREVDGPLGARADKHDALAASAALLLVDEDVRSPSRYGRWAKRPADDPDAGLRPLGARTLTWKSDGDLRRKLMIDPYAEVRRGALHASAEAGDDDDVELVLEAARLDPHVPSRKEAILTAGALGGARVVDALADLWPREDAEIREAVARAWGLERSFKSGGRSRLVWVVETQRGRPVLVAARRLLHDADGAVAGEAIAAFERAISDGPTADRQRAIEEAPGDVDALRAAILQAEGTSDEAVAATAMKRHLRGLLEGRRSDPAGRDALVGKLLVLARGNGAGMAAAREALAIARVADVVPLLEEEGAKGDADARIRAGGSLALYGDYPRAAVVAADKEARVRTTVSCEILRVSNRGQERALDGKP